MSDQVQMTEMNYDSDRPAAENPVKIMDLSLRDGHQSLFATRGRTEEMIPVAELLDDQVSFRDESSECVRVFLYVEFSRLSLWMAGDQCFRLVDGTAGYNHSDFGHIQ